MNFDKESKSDFFIERGGGTEAGGGHVLKPKQYARQTDRWTAIQCCYCVFLITLLSLELNLKCGISFSNKYILITCILYVNLKEHREHAVSRVGPCVETKTVCQTVK